MREQWGAGSRTSQSGRHSGARAAAAGVAAIGSVLAASLCCLPILPFAVAAGFAESSMFLLAARPYLLAASILLIAYGFWEARRAKKCHRRLSVIGYVALCGSALFVVISIFFPQVMANAVANWMR